MLRKMLLWAAAESVARGAAAEPAVPAPGRAPVHARRGDRGRARCRGRAPGARHRHPVHEAGRGDHRPGRRPGGGRSLPAAPRAHSRRGDRRRDQRQADPAGPRHRRGRLPRPSAHAGRRGRCAGLLPVDRHGGQLLRGPDAGPLPAAPRVAREHRHLPPGVPAAHGEGRRAPAAARPRRPARQGRLRRAQVGRLRVQEGGRCQLPGPRGDDAPGEPDAFDAGRPRHTRRGADRADRDPRCRRRHPEGRLRGPDAVRDPRRRAAAPRPVRLPGRDADRLRRRVVSLVHAPSCRAAGERLVRPAAAAP